RIPSLKDQPPYQRAVPGSDGWMQIIGILSDTRDDGLRNAVKPAVYVPFTAQMWMFTQILVRARTAPLSLLRDIRAQLVQLDPEQQTMRVRDLDAWITGQQEYAQQRLVATLFGIFSILALALAAVGLYSVVSYGVATPLSIPWKRYATSSQRAPLLWFRECRHGFSKRSQISLIHYGRAGIHSARQGGCRSRAPVLKFLHRVVVQVVQEFQPIVAHH